MTLQRALALGSLSAAAACSILVPGELDAIRCRDDGAIGPPACPPAEVCANGICASCRAREACIDRVDNDCNGIVDDGCGAGAEAGVDAGVGERCAIDADCEMSGFCSDPSTLGVTGTPFCTRGCCTSADCGAGDAVCWATPGGATLCIPAERVLRPTPGALAAGSACRTSAECRSAWCGATEGVCLDACCRNSDCTASSAPDCTLREWLPPGSRAFGCGKSAGARAYQDACVSGDASCRSGVCLSSSTAFCTRPCCTASDCGGLLECRYSSLTGSSARVCELSSGEGNLEVGEACKRDAECRSAWCLTLPSGAGSCTDTCCRDADCGDTARFACRLGQLDENWVLRCAPR